MNCPPGRGERETPTAPSAPGSWLTSSETQREEPGSVCVGSGVTSALDEIAEQPQLLHVGVEGASRSGVTGALDEIAEQSQLLSVGVEGVLRVPLHRDDAGPRAHKA